MVGHDLLGGTDNRVLIDLFLANMDYFDFPMESLEGDDISEWFRDAKVEGLEPIPLEALLGSSSASGGNIGNGASVMVHGLSGPANARSPVSVLDSSSSCSSAKTVSMSSEILIPACIHPKCSRVSTIKPVLPMPSVSSTPKRSLRIATYKALSQSSDFSELNLPNTIANPIRRKRKKEKKLSQLSGAPEMIQNSSEPFATKRCSHCQVTKTPQWREGPMGPKTLCNACGVRYRSGRLLPEYRPAVSPTFVPSLHSNSHRKIIEMRNQAIQEVAVSETKPQMSQLHKAVDEIKPPISPTQKAIHEAAVVEIEPLMSPPLKKKKLSGATEMMQNSSPQPVATKRCSHCEVTKTPEWREGPMGPKTICNACGVRYRSGHLFPEYRPAASPAFVPILHSNSLSMRNKAIREATMGESELPTSPPRMPIQDTVMAEIKPPISLTHKAIHKASSMAEIASPISQPHKVASHEAAMAETKPPMSQLLKKEDLSGNTEMIHNSSRRPASTKTGSHCEVTNIPQRSGAPMGTKTLCNVHSDTETPVVPKKCSHCAVTETPQWREGPMGPKTLCNACGIRYRSGRLLPEYRPAASPTFVPSLHSNSHREVVQMRRHKVTDEAEPPMSPPHKPIEEAAMVEVEPPMSPPPEFIPMSSYLIDCVLGGGGQY